MDIHQLPDLSDWRYVEIWTLEEAAMLWAAIDPMEHSGKRLVELKADINPAQYRKALLFMRAATEAVCAGTLPFAEAWEESGDNYHGYDLRKVDFPELPEPLKIAPHLTRVGQAAFMKWTNNKKILSYRQHLTQSSKSQVQLQATVQGEHQPTEAVPLLLPMPAFLDPSHPLSPVELRAGVAVWEIVVSTGAHEKAKSVKDAMRATLDAHPEYSSFSKEAKERVSAVANWNKVGGATKTPVKTKLPTPQK